MHFPRPPLEMMAGVSQLADDYGIDLWIWFPALDEDYSDPDTVVFALAEWREVFEALPRIDAIFVPGGDPGKTPPGELMELLEKQTAQLRACHAGAQMWISPQGFHPAWTDAFMEMLVTDRPDWLTGLVHGPWVNTPIAEFRNQVPEQYAIRNYPDITHTIGCQLPPQDWDAAFALTEDREPINPRPLDQAAVFRHMQPPTIGFLTYSEGCNDDVNKCVWSGLGWDPEADVVEVIRDYSRFYIGALYADDFAQGILALERNWRGALADNAGVEMTLKQFQAMEVSAFPFVLRNWRFQQALYRAYDDAYVRHRLIYETELETQAMDCLCRAPKSGALSALTEADRVLDRAVSEPVGQDWRTRVFQLAEALFQSIRMQLSVPLYRAQEELRGGNLDGIDFPLNNQPWLKAQFEEIRQMTDEAERLAQVRAIVNWTDPGPGGFYDDLCRSKGHVIEGMDYAGDPAFLKSPVRKFPYRKSPDVLRMSWRGYTGTLKDAPFEMHYPNLDGDVQYRVRIVYSDQGAEIPIRLEVNERIEVHPFLLRPNGLGCRAPCEYNYHTQEYGGYFVVQDM